MRVIACGVSAEWLGADALTVDAAAVSSASDLKRWLGERHPAFATQADRVVLAVTDRLLDDADPVAGLDEVAIIPPVSGG